jgi:hypothetical protein
MKTYTSKSNAKRAGIKAIVKDRGVDEAIVKADTDKFFNIEGDSENGFYPHFISDRIGVVSEQKEAEMKKERETTKELDEVVVASEPTQPGVGIKIEKDRPEQNGIVRPSVGGKCRAIWDFCDSFYASQGRLPMPKEMKQAAQDNGWNENNAVIEMYQWRKFNGYIGRQK